MDRVRNPYTPNAGATPPTLAGRAELIADFEDLLARLEQGRTDKGVIVTGLRGVGKTALLNAFEAVADRRSAVVIKHEAMSVPGGFAAKFPSLARKALLEISPTDRWRGRGRRAAGVLKGFKAQFDPAGRWTIAYDGSKIEGVADSGDFVSDLPELMVAIGEAAAEHDRTVVFLIDEIQYLDTQELSALVMAKHQINQAALPIVFGGAGLPQLPALTGEAQTYAERMFSWPEIGKLSPVDARDALIAPALTTKGSSTSPTPSTTSSRTPRATRSSCRSTGRRRGTWRRPHRSRWTTSAGRRAWSRPCSTRTSSRCGAARCRPRSCATCGPSPRSAPVSTRRPPSPRPWASATPPGSAPTPVG